MYAPNKLPLMIGRLLAIHETEGLFARGVDYSGPRAAGERVEELKPSGLCL